PPSPPQLFPLSLHDALPISIASISVTRSVVFAVFRITESVGIGNAVISVSADQDFMVHFAGVQFTVQVNLERRIVLFVISLVQWSAPFQAVGIVVRPGNTFCRKEVFCIILEGGHCIQSPEITELVVKCNARSSLLHVLVLPVCSQKGVAWQEGVQRV